MQANWLSIFFRFSGQIYRLKQNLMVSTPWYLAIYYALLLFFMEVVLTIISFPLYFLVSPKNIQKGGLYSTSMPPGSVQEYLWRRKISLSTGFGAVAVFLIKIILVGGLSFYLLGAQKLLADTQNWTFGTPSDYIYNSSTIEITGGVAQLKDSISTVSGSTTNAGFDSGITGWTYADWGQGGGEVNVAGARVTTGGNPGGWINISFPAGSADELGGYWRQPFTTTADNPSTTVSFNWQVTAFDNAPAPITFKLYVFIDTGTGVPVVGQEVWSSGEITGTSTWVSVNNLDVSSKVTTAGTYYLKVAAWLETPGTNTGPFTVGFDNVLLNWSKTTHTFATSSPSTTPVNSLSAPAVSSWSGFTETATKNGGEIYYQLSDDNGATWKYWNGTTWATAGATNSSTAAVVNTYITYFPTSTNQIKWRSFFTSNGSQQVILSGVTITYSQNDPPQIASLTSAQDSGTGNVHINYNLLDANSDPLSLVSYEYSLTGAFAGEQVTMSASTTDSSHSGVSGLSSSPTGVAHTFAWDARSQLGSIVTSTLFVRLRANDGIANSGFATSSVFAVDYVVPVVANVSSSQPVGTTTVSISYDLSDNNTTSSLNVDLQISSDGGSTWTVPATSATGNVGSAQTPGTGKTIAWNAGADFSGQSLATMQVRVRARDVWQNQGSFTNSTNFSLDTLAPATATAADLQAQPNAGDTTALIGGSFTETNPNTNDFYVALDGGSYGSAAAGDSNTASPAAQNTAVGSTLKGNNYISKVKIVHVDDYGQTGINENTSPATTYKYVKPYTPATPVVDNPGEGQVDVTASKNSNEADGLEYAIFETSQSKYVQADGTLGASAIWQQLGTGAGQWGNGTGVSGKVTVTGLSSPVAQYSFQVKSRNSADTSHAASSESSFSSAAGISNTAATISIISVSQQTGNSYVLISYTGTDAQNDSNSLVAYEYSTNATDWFAMTEKTGVGSSGTGPLSFTSAGASFVFAWNIAANLSDFESSVVRVRLKSNDGLLDSNLAESSAFAVDTKAPVVTNVSASQTAGGSLFTFTYDLADNSVASNTVQLQASDDNGATWVVPVTSATGDVNDNVSAGTGRSITWNAATDYPNAENSSFKIRIKGTDRFNNIGSFVESAQFTVDTKGPVVSSVSAVVSSTTNKVTVTYDLSDITTANNVVEFQVSNDDGSTWNVATTTVSGNVGSGQTTGAKTFIWDAPVDFAGQASSQMKVRVRATDYYGNAGSFAASSAFTLDTADPVISNLTASQTTNSTTVQFSYDLSDAQATASVTVQISSDSGSTWTVATTTLAGALGSSISTGSGKVITWRAGTDFAGQESNTVRVRLQATDGYGNSASFESADFSVDTLGPTSLANFRKFSSTASSVTLAWDSGVSDAHFDHYELWYGTNETEVTNRSGGSSRWSTAEDSSLNNILTVATTITGVSITTDFFVRIFAVDDFGNESALPAINVFTPAPTVTPDAGGTTRHTEVIPPPEQPLLFPVVSPSNKLIVTIAGLAKPFTRIDLYNNGNFVRPLDLFADNTGSFSQNISVNEGSHSFAVKAVDVNGNASILSEALVVIIDVTPPAPVFIFSPTANSVIGEALPTLIGGTEPGNIVSIVLDGENKFTIVADASGAWQFILPTQFALTNGRHSFVLISMDLAGNESSQTLFGLTKAIVPGIESVPVAGGTVGTGPGAASQFPLLIPAITVSQPTPSVALVRQSVEAVQVASLQVPKISSTTPTTDGGNFVFSGTALPNQEVLVYMHSSQALIYRTQSDNNGLWKVTHSQDVAELTPGDHTIFAVSVDPVNKVKSLPSAVQTFTVKKNLWVSLFNLLNFETTALSLMALGLTMLWLYRLRAKVGAEI